jgi:hypothetical protein
LAMSLPGGITTQALQAPSTAVLCTHQINENS